MIFPVPVTLEGHGMRLEPLSPAHESALAAAAADGELWTLWYTSVPAPGETARYIESALEGQAAGHMLPWAVRDMATGLIAGTNPAVLARSTEAGAGATAQLLASQAAASEAAQTVRRFMGRPSV